MRIRLLLLLGWMVPFVAYAQTQQGVAKTKGRLNSDGTVVDIPIGSGSQVWSNSDASTIYSSDSYFFNPNIGSTIEYQQMQLLR